jgi:ubiquinone/menaquinone biosynthesis C-methylase UbiE
MNVLYDAKWDKGKNKTLRFYRAKLPWKAKQFNREFELPSYFGPMIGGKKEITIAELGAGMFCTIGSTSKSIKVKVYPSDVLSDEFNQILNEAGVVPLIPVAKENMERLSYPDNFFDIVHCANALDHTPNPIAAIKEMYRVCKPGGWIYLRHFVNVGENEKYNGLHMWNIDINNNNECVIWNPDKKYLLSDLFKGFKSVKKTELDYETEDMVVSKLQK